MGIWGLDMRFCLKPLLCELPDWRAERGRSRDKIPSPRVASSGPRELINLFWYRLGGALIECCLSHQVAKDTRLGGPASPLMIDVLITISRFLFSHPPGTFARSFSMAWGVAADSLAASVL